MNFSKTEYERELARTRPQRMDWWKKARFGMFIHYGLYSLMGRHEWVQVQENIPKEEYELLPKIFVKDRIFKELGKYLFLTNIKFYHCLNNVK